MALRTEARLTWTTAQSSQRDRDRRMGAVAIEQGDALHLDAERAVRARQLIGLAAGIEALALALMLYADERGRHRELVAFTVEHLDVAHQVRGAWHRREHQRPRLEQPLHANGEDRMVLIDDRGNALGIGLIGLARHPVAALRRIEREPGLQLPGIEQARLGKHEQLDLGLRLVGKHHAAVMQSTVMQSSHALNWTRIGISLAAPEMLPLSPRLSLSKPREKSIQAPDSLARPCWQRS